MVIIQGLSFHLASTNELFSSVQLRQSCIPQMPGWEEAHCLKINLDSRCEFEIK